MSLFILEGVLHANDKASARHSIPAVGTATPDNICVLSPQLVEDVVYFNVELSLLISCVIKSKVVNAILIGRPALNAFLHAAFITDEVEAVEGSTEFILVIIYTEGCFVLRCIALSKAVLFIIEQMCPAQLNSYSIAQTSICLLYTSPSPRDTR